jgi:riboflavin synthase
MFTGLVEERGDVLAIDVQDGGARLHLAAPEVSKGLRIGDSVAVNGACLTAVVVADGSFDVDVVAETLRRTTIGDLAPGAHVNLERALRVGDRLGGHLVQGHVDGVGSVATVVPEGGGRRLTIAAVRELLVYVVEKGSITVDGVSLTVAARSPEGFEVALIPHTLAATTLGEAVEGTRVNLEVDLVAKYVEALAAPYRPEGST